jgi:hypothetical protein
LLTHMDTEQKKLEKRLWLAVEALLNSGLGSEVWLKGDNLDRYFKTFEELVEFHKSRGDIRETTIGFEGLNAYLVIERQLNEMLISAATSQYRALIAEKLGYLNALLDDIIAEGYTKMHSDEDEEYESDSP